MKPISFCINVARNELDHLKLLFHSLNTNLSSKTHEIIVFVESDNQNTFEWLLTQKSVFPNLRILRNNLPICYGYARNINQMFLEASNEVVSYLQSDMVICRDYDLEIQRRIQPNTVLCSTRIEPPLHGNLGEKITQDFGLDPNSFDLTTFTNYADSLKVDKYTDYFFAPFTMYKGVWNSIGGHDTLFRRSREDSDILIRLTLNGVNIKQTWAALVYHFTCVSSRGPKWFDSTDTKAQQRAAIQHIADQIELRRFTTKWGGFSHGLSKIKMYNIDAVVLGKHIPIDQFEVVQTHFHRVYVEDTDIIAQLQAKYDMSHQPANQLLEISEEHWIKYGYLYNQLRASDRIKPMEALPNDSDIVIRFNFSEITPQLYNSFMQPIQQIIDSVDEPGDYEYGPFKISVINKIDRAADKIKVVNPSINPEHLYTAH